MTKPPMTRNSFNRGLRGWHGWLSYRCLGPHYPRKSAVKNSGVIQVKLKLFSRAKNCPIEEHELNDVPGSQKHFNRRFRG